MVAHREVTWIRGAEWWSTSRWVFEMDFSRWLWDDLQWLLGWFFSGSWVDHPPWMDFGWLFEPPRFRWVSQWQHLSNSFLQLVQVRDMNGAAITTLLSEGANQLSKIKTLGSLGIGSSHFPWGNCYEPWGYDLYNFYIYIYMYIIYYILIWYIVGH